MIIRQNFSQAHTGIYGLGVFGATRNAHAASHPESVVPGLIVEWLSLRVCNDTANQKEKEKTTTKARRHGEERRVGVITIQQHSPASGYVSVHLNS
jgi:hypothetical protein